MKKMKESKVGKVVANARGGREEKKKKKKVVKEGEVQLLRELTAGDWAWLRRRVERRGRVRMESVEEEEEEEEDDDDEEEEDSPEEEEGDEWEGGEYKSLYCVGKRKWDQVLTLLKADQDGENDEEDEEEGSEEDSEEEHHEEREYKRRKLNRLEEEEEFLAADPTTKLNPILDRCHITNN
jgi:hypothetical protein